MAGVIRKFLINGIEFLTVNKKLTGPPKTDPFRETKVK